MKTKKQKFRMHLIRKAMKEQGFNQNTLAKKLKFSQQLMSYHFNNPTISSVWQIAYVLKLNLKDLIK